MRSRAVLLVVAILLIAAFAALNWGEIIRPTTVWFGPVVAEAPLAGILLGLLALAVIVFVVSAGTMHATSLRESRQHHKTLEAQRELADKAEASRFTDLRQHLDTQLKDLRDRDAIAGAELQKALLENQREMRNQLEHINRTVAARMTELEQRLDARGTAARSGAVQPAAASVPTLRRDDAVAPVGVRNEPPGQAQRDAQARDAQAREQQMRQEKARAEAERATATDRPAESGWRRWF